MQRPLSAQRDMKPLSNDHIDERGDLMRKKAWFLCVLLVELLFIV